MAEPSKQRPGDQPLPAPGRECVQDALIAQIEERKQLGIERYGRPLETHNGRNAVQDALEEAIDLAVYLKQVELEVRDLRAERDFREQAAARNGELYSAAENQRDDARQELARLREGDGPSAADLAGLAQVQAERDLLAKTLADVLREFQFKTHPGRPCLQSGHVGVETVAGWRAVLTRAVL